MCPFCFILECLKRKSEEKKDPYIPFNISDEINQKRLELGKGTLLPFFKVRQSKVKEWREKYDSLEEGLIHDIY